MNHDDAAALRAQLNGADYVRGPTDSQDGDPTAEFRLARVRQPGYLNGEPIYEVLVDIVDREHFHLPSDLVELVADRGGYIRVGGGTLHIRDWEAAGGLKDA
jgi:hypothetical protein